MDWSVNQSDKRAGVASRCISVLALHLDAVENTRYWQIRNPVLYPFELRARDFNFINSLDGSANHEIHPVPALGTVGTVGGTGRKVNLERQQRGDRNAVSRRQLGSIKR
jgi:hypothetical protein